MYHSALVRAQQEPDAKTCTAWVLNGIQNSHIRSSVIGVLFASRPADQEPTFQEIFTFVEHYLKRFRMGDEQDPYKAIKTNPTSPARVAANAAQVSPSPRDVIRCTKCWRKGHGWKECHAGACSICGKKFQGEFCTNWQNHTDPGTRWIPPKFRSAEDTKKKPNDLKRKTPPDSDDEKEKDPEILDKLKILQAVRKDLKKLRKEKKRE